MLTRTQIINNALQVIGANRIEDPSEESESARQAAGVYDQIVREELEKQAWSFAKAQGQLPANSAAPLFRFARAFTLPADFIRLVELEDRWVFNTIRYADVDPTSSYEIQGRELLTDLGAPLRLTYIRDVSGNPSVWPPVFTAVVAKALAVSLAMPLTKSEGMVSLANKRYQQDLREARRVNAIQKPPAHIPDGSWVTVRGGGAGGESRGSSGSVVSSPPVSGFDSGFGA